MRRASALLVALALFGACASGEIVDPGDDDSFQDFGEDDVSPATPGGEPDPGPVEIEEPETMYHGRYEVSTHMDVAGSGVLGEYVGGTLVSLSEFHDNPAGTILDLLALYGVPVFSTVWDLIPGFIEDEITGWLNDHLFAALFEGVPAVEQVVIFVDDLASISRDVELVTELNLGAPNVGGGMRGEHEVQGLAFTLWGDRSFIGLPADFTTLTAAEPHAALIVLDNPNPAVAQGLLRVDAHAFSIPYGDMLMDAAADLLFGGASSLPEYLNDLVDCTGVGYGLADECVWGACVGDFVDPETLTELCTAGLDLLGFVVEQAVRALEFDLLNLQEGRCEMYDQSATDPTGNYKIDALLDGEWDASISMFGTTHVMPNTFAGRRIADE